MASAPCLQIDLGNSSAKWRLVEEGQVVARGRCDLSDSASRQALLNLSPAPAQIWIASVAAVETEQSLIELLSENWAIAPWFARTGRQCGDLKNSYLEPERMGVDRWLAMLGARSRCETRFCVVDSGSALTIDLVAASGEHEGGYIIPGAHLMERALLLDTDRVRFDADIGHALDPGRSTAEAVRHGIALAQAGAVVMALERIAEPAPELFICGGGGKGLQLLLDGRGIYAEDLVFEGLELMQQG